MSVKNKLIFLIGILLTLLFISSAFIVEYLYSEFRKDEFKKRMEEKALTYVKLLIEVKEVDSNLLKIIDKNSIAQLYDEKLVIFNNNWSKIYESPNSEDIKLNNFELSELEKNKTLYKEGKSNELIGISYQANGQEYYVLVSANDKYGKKSLDYLIILLLFSTIVLSLTGWLLTIYVVKRYLNPLKKLHLTVSQLNANDLHERLKENRNTSNEIDLLTIEFNQLLSRLEDAYQKQRTFTSHASHELKTPLSRIILQLENLVRNSTEEQKFKINYIIRDAENMSKLIDSLLILAKVNSNKEIEFKRERIDELIFEVVEEIKIEFKEFRIEFNISESDALLDLMEVSVNKELLIIAFFNLLKNAFCYSENGLVITNLMAENGRLILEIINDGEVLDESEQLKLFFPFSRGKNSMNISGVGIGLVIVKRILDYHGFTINYSAEDKRNHFNILF
jgi:signal transduction histidine kinase